LVLEPQKLEKCWKNVGSVYTALVENTCIPLFPIDMSYFFKNM
jgi:hypothetical protein